MRIGFDPGSTLDINRAACCISMMSELEILFEYQGSRKPLCRLKRERVIEVLKQELARFGDAAAVVQLSGEESDDTGNSSVYLLQKWSNTWGAYIDVEGIDDLEDRDKVTVVPMPISVDPRPSSKVTGKDKYSWV